MTSHPSQPARSQQNPLRVAALTRGMPAHRMTKHARHAFGPAQLGLVLVSSALAIGCIQATADVPEMELTRENVEFAGANGSLAGTELTIVQQFSYANSPSLPESISAEMRATQITFRLRDGANDLSFIRAASLEVSRPEHETELVFDYHEDDSNPPGRSITLPIHCSPDALNPWSVATASFELTLTGVLPTRNWSADISLRYTGSLSLSL